MHSGSIDKHSGTTVAKPSRKLMIEFGLRRNALPTVETMELDSSKESEANDSEEKFLSEDDSGNPTITNKVPAPVETERKRPKTTRKRPDNPYL